MSLVNDRRQPRTFQGYPQTIDDATLRAITHLVAEYFERVWDDITGIYDDLSFLDEHDSDGSHNVKTITDRTAETSSVLADDLILLYDLSAAALRKMTLANATKMTVEHAADGTHNVPQATATGDAVRWDDWNAQHNDDGTHKHPSPAIRGLGLSNNGTDPDHDIDIAAGSCYDAAFAVPMVLASSLTKQIDAAWAVGTNQGGLDTGAVAANTVYAVWLIRRPDTGVVDALFSASFTAPSMPSNYTQKRLIGAVCTDAAANIIAFTQAGDYFRYTGDVVQDIADSTITSNVFETAAVSAPPNSLAHIYAIAQNPTGGASNIGVSVRAVGANDAATDTERTSYVETTGASHIGLGGICEVLTDASRQISYACPEGGGAATVTIRTLGFTMLKRSQP